MSGHNEDTIIRKRYLVTLLLVIDLKPGQDQHLTT